MKVFRVMGRIVSAGIISVCILSILMCFYSLTPVHIENNSKNTDYVWPANSVWVRATEGISWGRFDTKGFNNISVVQNPDIIVLGSSHMEAREVFQSQNTAAILSEMLKGDLSVYNMGISGHHFFKICQYVPANLELYEVTPKYVVIETSTVKITQDQVNKVLSNSVEFTPSYSTGLIGILQKNPFLRTLYQQSEAGLLNLFISMNTSEDSKESNVSVDEDKVISEQNDSIVDEIAFSQLFEYLSSIEQRYGTEIIIFYHPTGEIKEDGTIVFASDEQNIAFERYSKEFGLNFIDMTPYFEDMYYNDHNVAHGFSTGKLESGHLNKYGHETIAKALYDEIQRMEKGELSCQ